MKKVLLANPGFADPINLIDTSGSPLQYLIVELPVIPKLPVLEPVEALKERKEGFHQVRRRPKKPWE